MSGAVAGIRRSASLERFLTIAPGEFPLAALPYPALSPYQHPAAWMVTAVLEITCK